jgi:hypothetical protein
LPLVRNASAIVIRRGTTFDQLSPSCPPNG